TIAPVRPTAVAAPTPVAREAAGYTFVASAYIVVCVALMRPPVIVSMTMIGASVPATEIDMRLRTIAPATAPNAIVSIAGREPILEKSAPPASAPMTPPRLNAVMPLLATPGSNPPLASTVGSQAKPRYTASRQLMKDAHSAIVSRLNSALNSDATGARAGRPFPKPGDSGSRRTSTATVTRGRMPPVLNNARQPAASRNWLPRSPARTPPIGTHTIVAVTASGRPAGETYSAASVAAFGSAPPRPSPVRNLRAASVVTSWTEDVARVIRPNTAVLARSARFLPNLSPAMPASAPPAIIPT